MGSNYSFKEYGKNFENTLSASDLISLNQLKIKPRKITHLRVWIDEYIVGFECFYDGISAGARFGNEYREAEYFDFVLENYEHIYKVCGTSREIIDTLTFLTTYGRQFTVGKNRDGRYFELTSGIKIVKGFKVGFGRYLHKFGAFFGKRPSGEPIQRPMIRHQTFTSRYNPNFSNNQEYNQANRRFTSYPVHQNYELANANTSLFSSNASQPQINQASIKINNFNPCINEDEELKSEYQESEVPLRRGSIAGTRIKRSNSFSHDQYTRFEDEDDDENEKIPESIVLNPKKTNPSGIRYTNTFFFDDYDIMMKGHKTARMKELRIIHDKNFIFGLQGVYEIDGKNLTSQYHCFTNLPYSAVNEAILLAEGESITSIEGSFVEVINGLKITTSKGLIYTFGTIDLSINYAKMFRITIPNGKKLIAVAGGFHSYLHNISVYYN